MIDEIYDRQYQAGREQLHAGIDRLFASIGRSFAVMHRIQWAAPWNQPRRTPSRSRKTGLA